MRFFSRLVFVCVALFLIVPVLPAQTSNCICSGFTKARVESEWSFIDGSVFSRAREKLQDLELFGPAGVVNRPIYISGGALTASDSSLSSVGIFFTGWTPTASYTAAEKTAFKNAVNAGVNLVISSDDPAHSIADIFDVSSEAAGSEMNDAVLADHPILSGPFGRITRFRGAGAAGNFRSWPAGALLLASNSAGPSMVLIPKGTLSITAGAVLLISDIDILTTYDRTLDVNNSEPSLAVTDALMMNIVAFLCNPSTQSTAPHMVFPQFANGANNVSTMNLTGAIHTGSVNASISFRDDNGDPWPVSIVGQGITSAFTQGLTPNQTATFQTDGVGSLRSGWAAVRGIASSAGTAPSIGGSVSFFAPGLGSTSVGASEVAGGFVVPIVKQPIGTPTPGSIDIYTGLAVVNMAAKQTRLRLEIWDDLGRRADGTLSMTLKKYGHTAQFLFQLFPAFDFRNFRGTLRVISLDGLISVAGLQLGSAPGQFVALPSKAQYR